MPDDNINIIYCHYSYNYNYLIDIIYKISQRLDLPDVLDINLERDRLVIWNQYIINKKSNSLANLLPELAAQWHPTKNGTLTPEKVTISSGKKVWWRCEKGHEWQAVIASRSTGVGCPFCSGKRVLAGFNDLATINPELAAEWHPIKNMDLTPQDVTPMSNKKVWWKCKHGHEWQAIISNRNKGRGCPVCAGQQVLAGFNDLATINPELAAEWHPYRNGNLTPQNVMPNSDKKVWWQCKQGHEWEASIKNRNFGNKCPICRKSGY